MKRPLLVTLLAAGLIDFRVMAQQPVFANAGKGWVDSVLASLSLEEKIGQLFMVPAYSNKGIAHEASVIRQISDYHIGGVIFMQGGPVRQVQLVNAYQAVSKVPLLIAQDAEWGLGMRLDSTVSFPRQMMWGALSDHQLVYELGKEIGRQCARVGVSMNLAPVVDINNNPHNPVINDRSFGENRYGVALRGLQYTKGLQDAGVIACAKHFPGHGDTDKDSHYDLPVIKHNVERLDSLELYPYKIMIPQGVGAVMTAHLNIPALDSASHSAASLSTSIVTGLLRNELGFKGLIITDALTMQGVAAFNVPGDADAQALFAGNDILLFPGSIPKAVELIKAAIKSGQYSEHLLDAAVRRILEAKYWAGLSDFNMIPTSGLYEDLNNEGVEVLQRKLIANALTVAMNQDSVIPIRNLKDHRIALVSIGRIGEDPMLRAMQKYTEIESYQVGKDDQVGLGNLLVTLKSYDLVVVGLHGMSRQASKGFGVTLHTKDFLNQLHRQNKVLLCVFGNPYSLEHFDYARNVVVAYEDNDLTAELAGQLIFGGIPAHGKLPVTASDRFVYGMGYMSESASRLEYAHPQDVGVNAEELNKIDLLAEEMITMGAAPGANILVAREGRVIYHKAFGYQTYDHSVIQSESDLYDLASVTKVAATTLAIMKLYEEGKLNLDSSFATYVPYVEGTSVGEVRLRDAMTHTAGLKAWIPFYEETVGSDSIYKLIYCDTINERYCIVVADSVFMRSDWTDSVITRIARAALKNKGDYKYSDLGFYLLKDVVENVSGMPLNEYVEQTFYGPMGLQTIGFKPLERFPALRVVPTEQDAYFRHQEIRGYVHDMGAAMLGGVSGHAGLFSDANDLAVLFQMLLNGGSYGGRQYLEPETIAYFTKRQSTRSRRGLGFDKPEPNPNRPSPTTDAASLKTYGHTGFTGTCVWVDPEEDLIYIFLSNRTYPTMDNRLLITSNFRERIHQVIYDAIVLGTQSEAPMVNMPVDGTPVLSKP
jgi:beta-glucosidase-like glycosyl hydrolase/CubicO group peptidase (beta-lactamase class C family)